MKFINEKSKELNMNVSKTLFLILAASLLFGTALSYQSDVKDSGSTTIGDPPRTVDDEDEPIHCWDDTDNDGDGNTDEEDSSCVRPAWNDSVEGMIWDTHLAAEIEDFDYSTVDSEASNSPSPSENMAFFFEGSVFQNNQLSGSNSNSWSDTSSGDSLETYWIDAVRGESDDAFGFGFMREASFSPSDFPSYTGSDGSTQEIAIQNNRVIDAPHNTGADDEVCGNGIEDWSYDKTGDDGSEASATTDCREDFGRIMEKYFIQTPYEQSGLSCESDDASCDPSDCNDASCSSTSSCTDADCQIDTDRSHQNDDSYWNIRSDGDTIYETTCTSDAGDVASEPGCSADSSGCCAYNSTTGACIDSGNSGCSASGDEAGEIRSWEETSSRNCESYYSTTDGGSSPSGDRAGNSKAGTYTHFTAHSDSSWQSTSQQGGESGTAWCGYDYTLTVNADGPQGNGDGFIVIDERSGSSSNDIDRVVARESPDGSSSVGRNVHYGQDGSALSTDSGDYIDQIDLGCSGDSRVCIKYVDFYTEEGSGNQGSPEWESVSAAVESREVYEGLPEDSYSVCKAINRINNENGDSRGNDLVDCDYTRNGDNIAPLPQACGDQDDEHLILMEGPQINQGTAEQYLFHEQGCVSWGNSETDRFNRDLDENACWLKGDAYSEGSVVNVASTGKQEPFAGTGADGSDYDNYEAGEDSPDRQVCLNIDSDNSEKDYNHRYDDDTETGYGGQWYDLDDDRVNSYLRSNEGRLGLSPTQRDGETNYINYYYGENPNPSHPQYNPEGGLRGTALIADCGPLLDSCGDVEDETQRDVDAGEGLYFAFFEEGARDEDYHPEGRDELTDITPVSNGVLNLIKKYPENNQLGPGHYDYDGRGIEWWEDTETGVDSAVQYAYTEGMDWAIDSTGVPYPPWGASDTGPYADNSGNHYREDYTGSTRSTPGDDVVQKYDKAFGNSLAVEAVTDISGTNINSGDGYWIDPDNIRYHWDEGHISGTNGAAEWKSLVSYQIDLTGPDSGLGWDYERDNYYTSDRDPQNIDFQESGYIAYTDIAWKQENGGLADGLQPPMCGDDRYEFLLEERGESVNSEEYTGRYACADHTNYCVQRDESPALYEEETYENANEDGEDEGRLKQDEEYCIKMDNDEEPEWYDQDYVQEACRENSLYGELGQRWIPDTYINEHPYAVTGGIDDSWNDRLAQRGTGSLESDQEADNWNTNPIDSGYSPVDTGTEFDQVANPSYADYGFCAGDDSSEYMVTQQSQTRFIETDTNVTGVAADPDSCVLANDRPEIDSSETERMLYQEGEQETLNSGGTTRQIACFNGQWWGDWPVVFLEDQVNLELGETSYTAFKVINPESSARTMELSLSIGNEELSKFVSFTEDGNHERSIEMPAESSKTFSLEIQGNREIDSSDDNEIELQGVSSRGDLNGYDTIDVVIGESSNIGNDTGNTRDVPGLQVIQLIVIGLVSVAMFFLN